VVAGVALEMAVRALESGVAPAQQTLIKPVSYLALESLSGKRS